MKTHITTLAGVALTGLLSALGPAPARADTVVMSPELATQLAAVRRATSAFHDADVALATGYAAFHDKNGIYCIEHPTDGAMGIHYVNGAFVGDGDVDALKPEALIHTDIEDGP